MAIFNIFYANHGESPTSIEDITWYLRAALIEAGHVVNISPFLDGKAFNIAVELFSDDHAEILIDSIKKGIKCAVLVTELPTGSNTFNDFQGKEQDAKDRLIWDTRYRNFMKVAEACKTVWCLSAAQARAYAKILPSSWLHVVPIGHVDGFASVKERPDGFKDFDFVFTGNLTDRRHRLLVSLDKAGANVVFFKVANTQAYIRSNVVSRARICLGLRQYDEWTYPSVMRNYYHLMNGAFFLSEKFEIPGVLDDYIKTADPADFFGTCMETLKRDDLAALARHNLERFRQEVPLKPRFADFLAQATDYMARAA